MLQKSLFSVLISLFFAFSASAQKILVFHKKGKVKLMRYYLGDEIKVGLIDHTYLYGEITDIGIENFSINGALVTINSVKYVYSKSEDQAALKLFSGVFITAGVAYLPLVAFNRTINSDRPIVTEQAATISGSLITGGLLLQLFIKKKYKISEKRPLKIIDISL